MTNHIPGDRDLLREMQTVHDRNQLPNLIETDIDLREHFLADLDPITHLPWIDTNGTTDFLDNITSESPMTGDSEIQMTDSPLIWSGDSSTPLDDIISILESPNNHLKKDMTQTLHSRAEDIQTKPDYTSTWSGNDDVLLDELISLLEEPSTQVQTSIAQAPQPEHTEEPTFNTSTLNTQNPDEKPYPTTLKLEVEASKLSTIMEAGKLEIWIKLEKEKFIPGVLSPMKMLKTPVEENTMETTSLTAIFNKWQPTQAEAKSNHKFKHTLPGCLKNLKRQVKPRHHMGTHRKETSHHYKKTGHTWTSTNSTYPPSFPYRSKVVRYRCPKCKTSFKHSRSHKRHMKKCK